MQLADSVLEMHDVLLAGTSAVFVSGAFTEKDAEHTMLHMKHGHVLVEGQFEPVAGRMIGEFEDLADVEVVGNGEAIEFGLLLEQLCGDGVGDVE